MNPNITPLPWKWSGGRAVYNAKSEWDPIIADAGYSANIDPKEQKANAEYIAKSANAYPQLVEALKAARTVLEHGNEKQRIELQAIIGALLSTLEESK